MFHAQEFVRDASGLRGRRSKRFVDAAKIVVEEVERQRVAMAFFEKPFVRRVKQRMDIRIVRFCRSTCDGLTYFSTGRPNTGVFFVPRQTPGLYLRCGPVGSLAVNLVQHCVIGAID